jgi:mannose-6-phosphate isomerase-like protein (cupin superfamily)
MSEPRVVEPGEGEAYVLIGSELFTLKNRGDRGEGCSIFENATQAGYQGPPPHFHRNQNEDLYVLEGQFEFRVDDRTLEGGPGTFVHCPKGSVHTFRNTGEEGVGKLLMTFSPAGDFEAFLERLGEPAQEKSPPTPASEPPDTATAERLAALASEHGIEFVAPPPSEH